MQGTFTNNFQESDLWLKHNTYSISQIKAVIWVALSLIYGSLAFGGGGRKDKFQYLVTNLQFKVSKKTMPQNF